MRPPLALLALLALVAAQGLAAGPGFVQDPSGTTNYSVPDGWQVHTSDEKGVVTWRAEERHGALDSPGVVILALPDDPDSGPERMLDLLEFTTDGYELARAEHISPDNAHFLIDATIEEIPSKIVAQFRRDQPNGLMFFCFYNVPAERFAELGGESLLYSVTGQQNPFDRPPRPPVQGGPAPATPQDKPALALEQFDPQSQADRQGLLRNSAPITPEKLHGSWRQTLAYSSTGDPQVPARDLRLGERGHSHLLALMPDGTYRLTYHYCDTVDGSLNTTDLIETGRYRLVDGNRLHLIRGSYRGRHDLGGQRSPVQQSDLPDLAFLLGLCPAGRHLVLHGLPFEYSVATETNSSGQKYFQQAFIRL